MKADRDDAPHHVRSRRNNHWQFMAILSIGSVGTLAAMFMFAKPITIDVDQLQKAIKVDDQEKPTHQGMPQPPASEVRAYRPAQPTTEQQSRQTMFNERNYKPRTDINTIQSVSVARHYEQPQQRQQSREKMSAGWRWENQHGSKKETVGGTFIWYDVDGRIEWRSVCSNLKRGSLMYRDCRKAAKVTFARMCGSYKPACMAENHYNPL